MVIIASAVTLNWCRLVVAYLLVAALAFNLGIMHGFHRRQAVTCPEAAAPTTTSEEIAYNSTTTSGDGGRDRGRRGRIFPSTVSRLFAGASTADLEGFVQMFPLGAPVNGNQGTATSRSNRIVMLYTTPSSLPDPNTTTTTKARQVIRNCVEVKQIVFGLGTKAASSRSLGSCVAIVGRGRAAESFHIQKWMRQQVTLVGTKAAKSSDKPRDELQAVGRYQFLNDNLRRNLGMRVVPHLGAQVNARLELQRYLSAFDSALADLRPLAEAVAGAGSDKVRGTIVVLVTNHGHSVFLRNYVCAARAVGMDTSKILVFASDRPALDVGNSLGLATFYHEQLFAGIPEAASSHYGDIQYAKIVMSKAYCVHLVSQLGYNILFQDVDIVPYKANVLEWWIDKASTGQDLYFQCDFNTQPNYSPWVANSGSYFAVNNAKTKYFFAIMVFSIDIILACGSHQASMHAILSELSNLYSLRINTLQKEQEQLPINEVGFHFHRRQPFMKNMLRTNKSRTVAFHMNWNENADEKIRFFQQMGDWYAANETASTMGPCLETAMVKCHYRDLPSVVPCPSSPALHNNRKSFW